MILDKIDSKKDENDSLLDSFVVHPTFRVMRQSCSA